MSDHAFQQSGIEQAVSGLPWGDTWVREPRRDRRSRCSNPQRGLQPMCPTSWLRSGFGGLAVSVPVRSFPSKTLGPPCH